MYKQSWQNEQEPKAPSFCAREILSSLNYWATLPHACSLSAPMTLVLLIFAAQWPQISKRELSPNLVSGPLARVAVPPQPCSWVNEGCRALYWTQCCCRLNNASSPDPSACSGSWDVRGSFQEGAVQMHLCDFHLLLAPPISAPGHSGRCLHFLIQCHFGWPSWGSSASDVTMKWRRLRADLDLALYLSRRLF